MSRFFKSAAFPILIVVVLAFFAQKLISPGSQQPTPTYGDFVQQLQQGDVKSVDLKTKDNTITVKLRTGQTYEVQITDGTVRAMDFRQMKVDEDDFGLMTYDPAFTNTASCRSSVSNRSA